MSPRTGTATRTRTRKPTSSRTEVVVDLGCCLHNGEESVERLIGRYRPLLLYGFDPLLPDDDVHVAGETAVWLRKKAAWTHDGEGRLGVGSHTLLDATLLEDKNDHGEWRETKLVEFFDFGTWLAGLGVRPVVKMNIEGAEFPLLEDLHARGLDRRIWALYVAWHDERMGGDYPTRRHTLEQSLRCVIEPWYLW